MFYMLVSPFVRMGKLLGKGWRIGWLRIPLILIGVLSIFAAIWFGLPMTGAESLASPWTRGAIIGGILLTILVIWLIRLWRRRKAAAALEEDLLDGPVGDGDVVSERMQQALAKLKAAGGRTYLYDLPWYVIIGPPGAGKTTALANSGIEFPGSDTAGGVEGFGGTKNCDWWFAEDAVLIDTAGRYTTQDSDAESDRLSWTAFLETLKKGRPNQPINGVILAFSAEDMMTMDEGQLQHHAETVRARLGEIHETLKIDFPVYVMFTKADIVAGFREYFSSFSQTRRKHVWGVTFQTRDKSAKTFEQVAGEFDALISRLSDETMDRLAEEPDGIARIAIFGLPGQLALMRDNVAEFLRRVFEPTRYKSNAILRGFYFTSGTQEGTPIDQVLGAMSREEGGFQPDFMSGRGKSFFLHDLLTKVIFEERDWVGIDRKAVRRTMALRTAATVLIVGGMIGAFAAFGWSFFQNWRLLQTAQAESAAYFGQAQAELNRSIVDSPDVSPVLPHLQNLRLMTAGYADEREQPFLAGMGLGQRERVRNAAIHAYSDGLERMLRPRMVLHLENALPRLIGGEDTAAIYRALKVYMLLGKQHQGDADDAAVQAYFSEVWAQEFAGAGQFDERDQIEAHLAAMLELDDTREPLVSIDAEIVRRAQEAIVNLPLAEQAYASIKDRVVNSGVPDFNMVERVSGQVAQVFETVDGQALDQVGVPALYTFEGYWGFFLEELTAARDRLEEDKWVLGEAAERVGYEQQLNGLERELHRQYGLEFTERWNALIDNLQIATLSTGAPNYEALAAAASTTASPILELVEAIEEETRLTRLYDDIEGMEISPEALAGGGLGDALGDVFYARLYSSSGAFQRVFLEQARGQAKDQSRVGGGVAEDTQRRQVERIADQFRNWHVLLGDGPGAPGPIDAVLANLTQLRENRRQAALAPTPVDEQLLQQILSTLTANNTALPDDLGRWLNEIEAEFRSVAEDATMSELNRLLNDEVTQFCQQNIASSFPFGGEDRHVSPSIFGQFFGPNGRMDRFYTTHLAPHVQRTADGLQPIPNSAIGGRLNRNALRQFERAEAIRLAFFASGSPEPSVGMSVAPRSASSDVALLVLSINGQTLNMQPGGVAAEYDWPGQSSGVMIELFPSVAGRDSRRQFSDGRWAIVAFMRAGQAQVSGNVADVRHQVGGRTVTFRMEFDSTTVPFLMPELAEFACPTSME